MPQWPRSRGSLKYAKPPLGLDELVERLEQRGLEVPDHARARRYLQHIGYFRLSPYTIPFQQDRSNHLFRPGASFDDVLDLYVFDRRLRLTVMDALERVEVAVRAALTDHMSVSHQDPHWYVDGAHFQNPGRHAGLLGIVRRTCEDRLTGPPDPAGGGLVHRSALEHYLTVYGSPELPPSWLMVESLTIGQLAALFKNLKRRGDQNAIAKSLGVTAPVLGSWLTTYVRVRNICAHHGRLWNVGLGVYPKIPNSSSIAWLEGVDALPVASAQRLYPVLVSLQSVMGVVSPSSGWAGRLHALVAGRPAMNHRGMGFPEGWDQDPFWQRRL